MRLIVFFNQVLNLYKFLIFCIVFAFIYLFLNVQKDLPLKAQGESPESNPNLRTID